MKLGIIFTGGTIGSRIEKSGFINTEEAAPFRLLKLYTNKYGKDVEFLVEEPYRILSENLQAGNILKLTECIQIFLEQKDIEGIIVTHGTDTLQYSAALLGYLFGHAKIPIVLVSSNYILEDRRANGFTNFEYAVRFIKGQYGKGVFVSYCNTNDVPRIHRGTRLQPPVPYSDAVSSVGNTWYGKFEGEKYIPNPEYCVCNGRKAMFEDVRKVKLLEVSDEIIRIIPYPGMSYPEITDKTKAILHESFHSGTICLKNALMRFAKHAEELKVPLFLTGLSGREAGYDTVKGYRSLGIISLCESAVIAQYCKLWLAVSNGLEIRSVMSESVAEDFLFLDKMY